MSAPATQPQINFLEILFGDLGFTRYQRNAYLSREMGREIGYLDDLTVKEASLLITALKEKKEDRPKPDPKDEPEF